MSFRKLLLFASALMLFSEAEAQTGVQRELKTVAAVDLKRYSGKWYEVARYPNKFQKQCVGNTTAMYTVKNEGGIEVVNQCVRKDGTTDRARGDAKIADPATNAKLKVRFAPGFLSPFGFVWGDYWIVDLGANYEYAAVGDPKREYLWILSREPELKDAVYQPMLRRLEAQGFAPGKLEKTPQNLETVKGGVVGNQ